LILLAILAIPLAISAFEAAKPEYDDSDIAETAGASRPDGIK
jgi:hypothetical protein